MNGELIWVLSLLAVAIVLFATGRVRMDAVALFVIVAFALSGEAAHEKRESVSR